MKPTANSGIRLRGLALPVLALACALVCAPRLAAADGEPPLRLIPAGRYAPLVRAPGDAASVQVAAFWLQELPVTNAEYLEFVQANPRWRRSRVSRLFADSSYLESWDSDLAPGARAPLGSPVVQVSWFAARAYARWRGLRLPTTAEWERAASAGYDRPDGRTDAVWLRDLYAWLAKPTPAVLPSATSARPDYFGVRGLQGYVWEWVDDFNAVLLTGESRANGGLERNLFCGAGAVGSSDTSDFAAYMRMALRSSLKGNNTTSSLGFRCARDAAGEKAAR